MVALSLSILIVILALVSAADMYRRQRASGIATNWSKTWTTGLASIFVSLCAIGLLIAGLTSGYGITGVIAFIVVFVAGIAAIAVYARRRWRT